MRSFLKHLAQRWSNWCGDREMERAIRQHLDQQGVYGRTARLEKVRLVAVQRPGWLQIYRFEATARVVQQQADAPPGPAEERYFYGLVRDDGRVSSKVITFLAPEPRVELFQQWSEGLICLRGSHGLREAVN